MLYFVPTPIGNLEDITIRARNLLDQCSIIVCEDTRTTKDLLRHYNIGRENKKFYSLTSYVSSGKIAHLTHLSIHEDVIVVSEAGMPGFSDPGKELVKECHLQSIPFSVLPGANALLPAVVSSNFDTSRFQFYGFLPQKKGRQTALKEIISSPIPVFFYESVHRMDKLLTELDTYGFTGKITIAREISKLYEQLISDSFSEVYKKRKEGSIVSKGEFVVGIYS